MSEVAERLGVSRQAVQQRIDAGTLAARKVGNVYAVPSPTVVAAQRLAEAARERSEASDDIAELVAAGRRAVEQLATHSTKARTR